MTLTEAEAEAEAEADADAEAEAEAMPDLQYRHHLQSSLMIVMKCLQCRPQIQVQYSYSDAPSCGFTH